MKIIHPQRRARSSLPEHYAALLAEQAASGLSVHEFAARRGVSAPTLYQWRRRLAAVDHESSSTKSRFLAVDVIGPSRDAGPPGDRYEVLLANGIALRLPADFTAARVVELVTSLSSC